MCFLVLCQLQYLQDVVHVKLVSQDVATRRYRLAMLVGVDAGKEGRLVR